MVSTMIASISRVGLSSSGLSRVTTSAGRLATVIIQAETIAAATRNMMTAVVFAADSNRPYSCDSFSSL
jgi:hypothetical protein